MSDFEFRQNEITKQWMVLAPRRAKRSNENGKTVMLCPFCVGNEDDREELYRVPRPHPNPLPSINSGQALKGEGTISSWLVRVIANKFPFADHHELIIHSPDHHKNFDELPFSHVELLLQTYRARVRANVQHGKVYLFHNRGHAGGESMPHPHTQLVVVPHHVQVATKAPKEPWFERLLSTPRNSSHAATLDKREILETDHFLVFCPPTSEWPDEVWVEPQMNGKSFAEISDVEISDLAFVMARLVQLFSLRHFDEFPFNIYITPGNNWYLRLVPRAKILGGFELATGIMVNTQDPAETFSFLKEHFWRPDHTLIMGVHQASYARKV